jgi:hypothetical protein
MRKFLSLLIVCILFANLIARSAIIVDTTVVAASGKHKLVMAIPDDYDKLKKYPLVIGLPKINDSALEYLKDLQPITDSLKMIVCVPDNSGQIFSDPQFDVITTSIDSAKSIFNIDEKSIYFNGMSLDATYVLHEGLQNLFPFKGLFPWAPYQPSVHNINLNSKMPVVISIGTADEYGTGSTLLVYDSLKMHGANVNLVLLPGIKHVCNFPDFGNEMIRCLYYLNDTGLISIQAQDTSIIEMIDTVSAKNLSYKVSHKLSKEIILSSLSSDLSIIPNPIMTYTAADSTVTLNFKPIAKKFGRVELILEAREKNGTAINQITTRVMVKKLPTEMPKINMNFGFIIYPNPATDHLIVESKQNYEKGTIDIMNITGQQIAQNNINSKLSYIDISNLNNGLYVIKIITENGVTTQKFFKK